jgi:hypothetical protein
MLALYESVLAHVEDIFPGSSTNKRVRDTVASALTALRATGQQDRDVLRRYAEYFALSAARLGPIQR